MILRIEWLINRVSFSVRDYGIGLNEDQLPYIFEGKYTHDSADSHRGIGIGLSICKTIITAHSGTIAAFNHEDGANDYITKPFGISGVNWRQIQLSHSIFSQRLVWDIGCARTSLKNLHKPLLRMC